MAPVDEVEAHEPSELVGGLTQLVHPFFPIFFPVQISSWISEEQLNAKLG